MLPGQTWQQGENDSRKMNTSWKPWEVLTRPTLCWVVSCLALQQLNVQRGPKSKTPNPKENRCVGATA